MKPSENKGGAEKKAMPKRYAARMDAKWSSFIKAWKQGSDSDAWAARGSGESAHGPPSLASEQASGDLFIAFSANGHLTAERNPNGKPGALRQTKAASPGSRLLFVL